MQGGAVELQRLRVLRFLALRLAQRARTATSRRLAARAVADHVFSISCSLKMAQEQTYIMIKCVPLFHTVRYI